VSIVGITTSYFTVFKTIGLYIETHLKGPFKTFIRLSYVLEYMFTPLFTFYLFTVCWDIQFVISVPRQHILEVSGVGLFYVIENLLSR